jgi:hypothetical protein
MSDATRGSMHAAGLGPPPGQCHVPAPIAAATARTLISSAPGAMAGVGGVAFLLAVSQDITQA